MKVTASQLIGFVIAGALVSSSGAIAADWSSIQTPNDVRPIMAEQAGRGSYELGEDIIAYPVKGDAIELSRQLNTICLGEELVESEAESPVPIDGRNYFDGVVTLSEPFAEAAAMMRSQFSGGFQYALMPTICSMRPEGRLEPILGFGFLNSSSTVYLVTVGPEALRRTIETARMQHQSKTASGYELDNVSIDRVVNSDGMRRYILSAPVYNHDRPSNATIVSNMAYTAETTIAPGGDCEVLYNETILAERVPAAVANVARQQFNVDVSHLNEASLPLSKTTRALEISPVRSGPSRTVDRYVANFTPDQKTAAPIFAVVDDGDVDPRHAVRWEMPGIEGWLKPRHLSLKNLGYLNFLHRHIVRDCESSRVGTASNAGSTSAE